MQSQETGQQPRRLQALRRVGPYEVSHTCWQPQLWGAGGHPEEIPKGTLSGHCTQYPQRKNCHLGQLWCLQGSWSCQCGIYSWRKNPSLLQL